MSGQRFELKVRGAGVPGAKLGVDRAKGIVYGAQVIQAGGAKGHDFYVDQETLANVVECGNKARDGIKCRWEHPSLCTPTLGTYLGRHKNFRLDGDTVRADLHLYEKANAAKRKHVLDMAEDNPDMFGQSIHAYGLFAEGTDERFLDENGKQLPVLRVTALSAVDVVDEGAATSAMLSVPDPGVELSARTMVELRKAMEDPGFAERALEFFQAHGLGELQAAQEPEDHRDRTKFILGVCAHRPCLQEHSKIYPNGLMAHALECDMSREDFLLECIDLIEKKAKMDALLQASEALGDLGAGNDFYAGDPHMHARSASLESGFFERFRSLGYSEEDSKRMAAESAGGI